MQVNYKTISSYEYDSVSGVFKKVDKEVEDTSGSSFMDMLGGVEQEESDAVEQSSSSNSSANSANQSSYANMSNIYAYRFRQNTDELSLKAEQQTNQKDAMLNNLLNTI